MISDRIQIALLTGWYWWLVFCGGVITPILLWNEKNAPVFGTIVLATTLLPAVWLFYKEATMYIPE